MKHYYILILLAAALGFSGCESDLVSNNQQNTPKYNLEVIPDTLYGSVYEQYTFKARLNGMATSDVDITWDFGDSSYYRPPSHSFHEYHKPGDYTIMVKAYDSFRDTLLATKIVPAYIASKEYITDLTPNSTDTTLFMNSDGTFKEMTFSFTTSFPLTRARAYWSFSDGIVDTFTYNYSSITHSFKAAGTYQVKVKIKDDYGNLIGEDSSTITIHHEPFDISTLTNAKRVSVTLSLDSVPAPLKAQGYVNPVSFGQNLVNDANTTTSWNGSSFTSHYQFNGMASSTLYQRSDYDISGTLSSDLQTLERLTLAVYDSTNDNNITIKAFDLGFSVYGLKFHAITGNEIIYKIVAPPLTSIASDLRFRSLSLYLGPCIPPDAIVMHFIIGNEKKYPYAYVIFTR